MPLKFVNKISATLLLVLSLACMSSCSGTLWERSVQRESARQSFDADGTERGPKLNPYHNGVRKKVMAAFRELNQGNPEPALALMDDKVVYTFEGDHALGGTRHSKAAVREWFKRLLHLVPSQFSILTLEVSGPPGNTRIYLEFEDRVKPLKGDAYVNRGVQISYLRWGKAYQVHTYVDTSKLAQALKVMAAQGVTAANAAPILD